MRRTLSALFCGTVAWAVVLGACEAVFGQPGFGSEAYEAKVGVGLLVGVSMAVLAAAACWEETK